MKTKNYLSSIALLSAVAIMFIAVYLEPKGIIDTSVLYVIAQLLVYSASMLGITSAIKEITTLLTNKKNRNESN